MPRPLDGVGPDPQAIDRPWIGSYPPGVPPTYRYPAVLLTRFLDDAARDFPEVIALDAPGYGLTYAQLVEQVDRVAGALEGLGVLHGTPLGLLLDHGPAAAIAAFAAWRMGAVVVPLDPTTVEGAELHRRLAATGCRVLLTSSARFEQVRTMRGALPALHAIVVTSETDWQPRLRRVIGRLGRGARTTRRVTSRDDVLAWSELLDRQPPRRPQRHADGDDTAVVLFDRDGTALAFSHEHLVAATFQSRLWIPDVQAGRERVLVTAALDEAQGLVAGLLDPVLSAATIVVAPTRHAADIAERVEGARPTLLRGHGGLFDELADTGADLTSLRACLATDGELTDATLGRFVDSSGGARLRQAYGPVAAAGLTHANPVYGRALTSAIGLPVSDTVACVVDPADPVRPLPPGHEGRLLVHGPQVSLRRWAIATAHGDGEAQLQAAPSGPRGWLDTGDDASVDHGGWFTVVRTVPAAPDGRAAGARDEHVTAATEAEGGILGGRPGGRPTDDEDQP